MKVLKELRPCADDRGNTSLTLGNFDGVHRGHQKIIQKVVQRSSQEGTGSCVVTFDPHPRKILRPHEPLQLILSLNHKIKILSDLGVDQLIVLPFDYDLARTQAQNFIREYLWPALRFKSITVGENYRFGCDRRGDIHILSGLGSELGFEVDYVKSIEYSNTVISSSAIRKLIHDEKFDDASQMLGRPYSMLGTVVRGTATGRELGFRTANLHISDMAHPPMGVYFVEVSIGRGIRYAGIANLGVAPTFPDRCELLEVHLLDFDQDIYGQEIEVFYVQKIRAEMKFESRESLRRQIERDISHIREKFLTI